MSKAFVLYTDKYDINKTFVTLAIYFSTKAGGAKEIHEANNSIKRNMTRTPIGGR